MRANLRLLFFLFFFWCFFLPRVVAVVLLQQFGSVSKVGAGRKGLSSIGLSLRFHRVLLFGISLYLLCFVLFCFFFFRFENKCCVFWSWDEFDRNACLQNGIKRRRSSSRSRTDAVVLLIMSDFFSLLR
jgi:hypothetical protein